VRRPGGAVVGDAPSLDNPVARIIATDGDDRGRSGGPLAMMANRGDRVGADAGGAGR